MARVRIDREGVRLVRTGPLALFIRKPLKSARWSAVDRVWALREGRTVALTFDAPGWSGLTVDDRTPGWKRLVAALPAHLDRADPSWREALARGPGACLVWERI